MLCPVEIRRLLLSDEKSHASQYSANSRSIGDRLLALGGTSDIIVPFIIQPDHPHK
jgi:hypothetical protein